MSYHIRIYKTVAVSDIEIDDFDASDAEEARKVALDRVKNGVVAFEDDSQLLAIDLIEE